MQKIYNSKKRFPIKRSAARLYAVQALFQMEASKTSVKKIISEFENYRIGASIDGVKYQSADLKMFREILEIVVTYQTKIDRLTNNSLKKTWQLDRIDPTLRALFRAATAELINGKTPPKATINEYIDLSKAFFPEGRESKLVNGVLNNILENITSPI